MVLKPFAMTVTVSGDVLDAMIHLGNDLFAMKLYFVSVSTLWFYDYFLTFRDEVEYAWKGKKTPGELIITLLASLKWLLVVFWLFILNRYLCPAFVIIALVSYFLDAWTVEICSRYSSFEVIGTFIMTNIAEIFLTLRIYALLEKPKLILYGSGLMILLQSVLALYTVSQAFGGTDNPVVLLSGVTPDLPVLPDIDAFHICVAISSAKSNLKFPTGEVYLSLCLAFDGLAFIGIIYGVAKRSQNVQLRMPVLEVIKRDGILYFFVLFSSNLVWLILLLHARPSLKFFHNQPAMYISAIMINRITLNLKKQSQKNAIMSWSTRTFEHIAVQVRK